MHTLDMGSFRTNSRGAHVVRAAMKITKVAAISGGIALGALPVFANY